MSAAWTPAPVVVTLAFPDASIASRSCTLSTASVAVGEHTPPEHVMFAVGAFETTTLAAEGAEAAETPAKTRHTKVENRIAQTPWLRAWNVLTVC
jgi:hypothetical protein